MPLLTLATDAWQCALIVSDQKGDPLVVDQFPWSQAANRLRRVLSDFAVTKVIVAMTYRHRWLLALIWSLRPEAAVVLVHPRALGTVRPIGEIARRALRHYLKGSERG
ncbi:MAG: hypothetical protein NZ959_09345 [Armatimonadetes bacterium]|nr:hypothetical protein [Armatimonadota bacterium]MDW8122158.1 hypothetical protein [Armatimonadota bacterium]